jgi:CBS domain-containing protein
MSARPVFIDPESTLEEAAKVMKSAECGSLPVMVDRKLKGIITDRDIVIRAVSRGRRPQHEIVADYMTPQLFACTEDDTLKEAFEKMHACKVTRLVVLNRDGDVTGILSLGGIMRKLATPGELTHIVERAQTAHIAA